MKRRLLWQIFPAFLIITAIGLLFISVNVSRLLKSFYYAEKEDQLVKLASISVDPLPELLEPVDHAGIQQFCLQMSNSSGVRFTVIDLNGEVLGESSEAVTAANMENHFRRDEVQDVLVKGLPVGRRIDPSPTLGDEMMYVAIAVKDSDDRTVGVFRAAVATTDLQRTLKTVYGDIFRDGAIIAAVLVALSLLFSWKISRPLNLLRLGAERFAVGDLSHRLEVPESREIGALADAMNKMAGQLDERIKTIVTQKNEQQAVLSSMIEGVIAVGIDGTVLSLNNAAAKMLNESSQWVEGRSVEAVVRNTELQRFVRRGLKSDKPVEAQIVLHETGQAEQYIQTHGTALQGDTGKVGVLVVMNDVTHIRRLEQIRRDFVANVSHELKTPVTSIKGFIETLQDGAMNKPEDSQRFLQIIARQTDRLNSIIDDLLTLSRVEQQSEQAELAMEPVELKSVLAAAVSLCEIKATKKKIQISVMCDESILPNVNASLLEQAVVNLVDNAIKYSDPESRIRINAEADGHEIKIHVADEGCGIAQEHLPRLFERFYRVDKARSRSLGGTGLGLAIVKHITQYHKGSISVTSQVDQGSTFTIHLPH